jgi:hypothetical protein
MTPESQGRADCERPRPEARPERASAVLGAARGAPTVIVAHFLLAHLTMSACLPPDYEIAPDPNAPVTIDEAALPVSPAVFHRLGGCPPAALELDVLQGLGNPDGDRLYSAWLVNHVPGQGGRPEATSTTTPSPFAFDPCTNPKVVTSPAVNTIAFVVLDRAPLSFDDGDAVRTPVDADTTFAQVVWFVGVDDLSCCGATP